MNAIVRCVRVLVLIACACVFCCACRAEEKPQPKRSVQSKEVTGELAWKGQNKLTVIYQRDEEKGEEYEMLIPYDDKLIIEHKRNMSEFSRGDVVKITYAEETLAYPDRVESSVKAVKISYVKKSGNKMYEAVQASPAEEEDSAPASAEPLTLKGAK